MSFNLESGIYLLNGEPVPIVELTNSEIRQAIYDLTALVVDTNGENDEFVVLCKEELANRNEPFNNLDEQ